MGKKRLHSKLYTSMVVSTTLLALVSFNQKTVEAEEVDSTQSEKLTRQIDESKNSELSDDDTNSELKTEPEPKQEQEPATDAESATDSQPKIDTESNDKENVPENIEDEEAIEVEEIREASMATFSARSSVQPQYTTTFIDTIAPTAVNIGEEYGLYPSVIIAQAALESGWGGHSPALPDDYVLSLPPNYNLFGVKGDYKGESVPVKTKEYNEKTDSFDEIVDYFRKYPSYTESLLDYANKMIYNTTTADPYFYSGTWVENTENYKDATEFLTGRYATDPSYGDKLNRIIGNYNLEQYDAHIYDLEDNSNQIIEENLNNDGEILGEPEEILENQSVAYYATLKENVLIYSTPGFNDNFEIVATTSDLSSPNVSVKEEVITDTQTWARIELDNQVVGWIPTDDLNVNYLEIHNSYETAYNAKITNPNINIYNTPAWTEGNKLIANSRDYIGENLVVKEEAITKEATYAKVELNGEILGWININGLTGEYNSILENRGVAYNAEIVNSNINIYSAPAWTEGNQLTEYSSDYVGQDLVAVKEASTTEGIYVQVEYNGEVLGWINRNGITGNYASVLDNRDVAYNAEITNTNINIYNGPAWTRGNVFTARSSNYVDQKLTVSEEIITEEAVYARVATDGNVLGWINIGGITPQYDSIEENREVAYNAEIINTNMNIYSQPAWTKGSELVEKSSAYTGENLIVKAEIVTNGGTYAQVEADNQILGWININGITGKYDTIIDSREVAYNAEIVNPNINFYNVPAWTRANRLTAYATDYKDKNLVVKEESITQEGTYARVEIDGQNLGWINVKGITPKYYTVNNTKEISYAAEITNPYSNIYSVPAWTEGNELVAYSADYVGEIAFVSEELTTDEATYAFVTINGTTLGWVNTNALTRKPVVYIDPGHGGDDSGASTAGVLEKDLNLSVSKKVEKLLKDKDYIVVMSRDIDEFITLSGRAQEANNIGADIFVSIHHNSFNGSAHGIETFYYNERGNTSNPMANDDDRIEDSKSLAEDVHKELISETKANDRGVKRANFHVLRETEMPAVLVEGGFIDNTIERAKLVLESYQQKLAEAVTTGIDKFLNFWF